LHDGRLGGFERELFEADALLFEQAVGARAKLGVHLLGARADFRELPLAHLGDRVALRLRQTLKAGGESLPQLLAARLGLREPRL
jgi:hypothetical protein